MPESAKTIKIFVAYSPSNQDKQLKQLLENQLRTMQNQDVVIYWYQHQQPENLSNSFNIPQNSLTWGNGKDIENHLDDSLPNFSLYENFYQLQTADVIVLLVSGDFLTLIQNEIEWNSEISKLREKHQLGEIVAIPILVDKSQGWQKLLGNFTPLPKNGMPVQSWQNPDAAFTDIFQGIEAVVEGIREYHQRLQEYRYSFANAISKEFPLGSEAMVNLDKIKKSLIIKTSDCQLIETEVVTQAKQEHNYKLQQYKQELIHFLANRQNKHKIVSEDRRNLKLIQEYLGLNNEDTLKIEQSVIAKKTTKDIKNIINIAYKYTRKIFAIAFGVALPIALIITTAASITFFLRLNANNQAQKFIAQAEIKFKKGDYQGAVTDFTQAINNQPQNIDAYIGRGNALSYLKDYQAAIQDYTKVINMPSESAIAYMNRAVVNCTLGEKKAANQDYKKAAKIYQELGALNDMQKALERLNNLQLCLPKKSSDIRF
ncbi:MAG: tetratricopeptide repeat protein [Calothrix sp. CSU_2_0]|nr:tetratricopeptide repeat protein [Calothrix sp. CSU_2_0]